MKKTGLLGPAEERTAARSALVSSVVASVTKTIDVGLGDGRLDVRGDPGLHRVVALGVEAAGVDQRVAAPEGASCRRSAGRA